MLQTEGQLCLERTGLTVIVQCSHTSVAIVHPSSHIDPRLLLPWTSEGSIVKQSPGFMMPSSLLSAASAIRLSLGNLELLLPRRAMRSDMRRREKRRTKVQDIRSLVKVPPNPMSAELGIHREAMSLRKVTAHQQHVRADCACRHSIRREDGSGRKGHTR